MGFGAAVRVHPPELAGDVPAFALSRYAGPVRAALLAYKERGRRSLAEPLGERLALALLALPGPLGPFTNHQQPSRSVNGPSGPGSASSARASRSPSGSASDRLPRSL